MGRVGCGKSSLLATILRETLVLQGTVESRGSFAYAEQEACIFSDSLRSNILFGREEDSERLQAVVRVCQLEEDIAHLSHGLDTEIGEKGVNISGGQRARICLARACYADADIYLLDDPLSAVDPRVAKKLFYECIRGFLANKAVVLVTHSPSFLQQADHLVLLDAGHQVFSGSFHEY